MRDLANNILVKRVLSCARVTDNTAQVGQVIDLQGYNSLTYTINVGTVADADATFTVLLEESDVSNTDFTAVADADMISQTPGTAPETAASFRFDDDNEVRKLGYIGNKRYTRLTITPANNSGNADFGAEAILGNPAVAPVTQTAS
jgi:hypothetical protein